MTLCAVMAASAATPDAFPGAEGFGRSAQGGRGGRIVEVTNLLDKGRGSLRACVLERGPRTCVFRVAGLIVLEHTLLIDGPAAGQISILGQTAPGEGITLTVTPMADTYFRTVLAVRNTQDVVLRHLRLRAQSAPDVPNVDALTVEASRRVYADHLSGAWASDENVSTYAQVTDLTIAYSIWGEGLRVHSKCALLASHPTGPQSISFWRNLCISNNDRNPDANHFAGSCIEIVDNLFYNARSEWAEVFSQKPGGTPISYVGNTFKAGPSTNERTTAILWQKIDSAAPPRVYARNNAVWAPRPKSITLIDPEVAPFLAFAPQCPLNVSSFDDPGMAYRDVLARAGAFPRDPTDARFVREVGEPGRAGHGKLRMEPGSIDPIAAATPYADEDHDAMPDAIEERFGATPGVYDPWTGVDVNGWSNLDRTLQWLAEERQADRYPQ
ncbi:pectate lyase [Aureimonas sp. AU12]|uniref:pectate lyase n=1 Tax=Aureimonas sp. AU12 TaxID=1638161 RepID=UPI0012E3572B|nr:pectate lyase [Aureimonas sp. AU12]